MPRGKRPPNLVLRVTPSCIYFRLTRGRVGVISRVDRAVLVDRWGVTNNYVARRVRGKTVYLHRVLMKPRRTKEVDHRNGNKLDNRRANLRVVTVAQQQQNKPVTRLNVTGHRNVFLREDGAYDVVVRHFGTVLSAYGFPTLKAAHNTAKRFRRQLFTHHNEARSVRES